MFAKYFARKSWLVALVAAALVAGDALADRGDRGGGGGNRGGGGGGKSFSGGGGGKGGGGGGSRSFSGGGGGGRSSSMRSSRGGGGGGSSMKNWSGGSPSGSSMRSSRSSGGSGKSAWSGGGGSSRSRGPSFQGGPGGGGGSGASQKSYSGRSMRSFSESAGSGKSNANASKQLRNFSGGNFSGGNPGGVSSDAARQHRAYRAQGSESASRNLSGGSSTRQRASNDQLQQMFKKYQEQQASGVGSAKQFDRSRGRTWSNTNNQGGEPTAFNQLPGSNPNGKKIPGRGNWNRSGSDGELKQTGDVDKNLYRFRNGSGDNDKKWSGGNDSKQALDGQMRRWRGGQGGNDGKGPGSGQFGNWSKKGGDFDPKTARWYGRSGFGDHRGRGDHHDGDHDDQFADAVRKNWQKDWWNKHGGHGDHDGHGDGDHGDHHGNHGHGRWDKDVPFGFSWWGGGRNLGYHYYWRDRRWRDQPFYWWNTCSAPLLTTWVDFGWNVPCYWDYGPGEYITYYNNTVYVDNQRYATALDYYAQVRNLARSVPALTQDQLAAIEWLPLGVFAVTRPGAAQSNELMQLAVSKDGILSGTLLDQRTGQARPLQGMVEQATQKAAWTFADSPTDALVVETSLFNLTEPECTALAHFDAVTTEVWQLVRLQQPQQPAGGPAPGAVPAGGAGAPAPAAQPVLPVLPPQGAVQ